MALRRLLFFDTLSGELGLNIALSRALVFVCLVRSGDLCIGQDGENTRLGGGIGPARLSRLFATSKSSSSHLAWAAIDFRTLLCLNGYSKR